MSPELRRRLGLLLGLAVLLGALAAGWLAMDYRDFTRTPLMVAERGYLFEIEPGSSLRRVADRLARDRVLRRPHYLVWLARREGLAGRIQAGEYRIDPGTRPAELLAQLVAGRVVQHPVTIVEGWTFRELRVYLDSLDTLQHELRGLDDAAVMQRIGQPGLHPEGRFLPDTYHFPRGARDSEVLRRAFDAMQKTLQQEWATRDEGLPLKTPYEALILASIVEKETALPEERPQIAGVFIRRLRKGMRLQTDPTVIYGLGADFDGNIRYRDLRRDTPYNTYLNKGLPPTPIALPGVDAIRAVLHPAPGKALYFVARGDGSHQFSATLQEHNRAVRRYQLKR
ncbi:endolytic transglycosylase MltG [Thiohalobacter sp. IOR34]|uniref:endolytic transglycosylase MltG n=1 Tax=Thiohalobacter sp. IOR34 TaxID=3057176 RepID=UPI0025AED567|nr:endolytic transglycosylase MltG [Thiohalobacter sp. IOR34]WJW74252.1 endolytic transglycosylase MltG [Thiohalobacter sp. IOR34]